MAAADDGVVVAAELQAGFVCCSLKKASDRRTLGSSDRAVKFLERAGSVPASTISSTVTYVCKPCLRKLENGQTAFDGLQALLSKCRQHFGLCSVLCKAIPVSDADSNSDCPGSMTSSMTSSMGELEDDSESLYN